MRATRLVAATTITDAITINEQIVERCDLAVAATTEQAAVSHFVITRGAERAWAAINQELSEPRGALFWIGGPAGTGKTHFLNYVSAVSGRTAILNSEPGRHLVITLPAAHAAVGPDLIPRITELIANELSGDGKASRLWRQLDAMAALRVALDQAKRQGVRAITMAIDFGEGAPAQIAPAAAMLGELARSTRAPKLMIVAAGRVEQPAEGLQAFAVAAAPDETAAVAIGCARWLNNTAAAEEFTEFYRGLGLTDAEAAQLFPFAPAAASLLNRLVRIGGGIAAAARFARDALRVWGETAPPRGPIQAADLTNLPALRELLAARLGATGRAALQLAYAAAASVDEPRRATARRLVEYLVLHQFDDPAQPPTLAELSATLSRDSRADPEGDPARLADLAGELAERSRAIIVFEPTTGRLRFNPSAAAAPEIAAFNAALPLINHFDASLGPVNEPAELRAAVERLRAAMASALEYAARNRKILRDAARESASSLSAEREGIFADYLTIADGGPRGLLAAGADADQRAVTAGTLQNCAMLAALAAATPRIRAMRDYLQAMGLQEALDDDPHRDAALARVESECKLLLVAVNAAVQAKTPSALDALDSRFQRFKWTYVPYYRAAHEQWRREMDQAAEVAADLEHYSAALDRLNAIAALGAPLAADLTQRCGPLAQRVTRCELAGQLSPEITPCCPQCNFVLGTPSPREELADLLTEVQRALESKLAILSRSAIARLIQQHDHSHRLEGFLKITQAAQTDALVRVLDDKLARYLGRLLDENLASNADKRGVVVRAIRRAPVANPLQGEPKTLPRRAVKQTEPGGPRGASTIAPRSPRGR